MPHVSFEKIFLISSLILFVVIVHPQEIFGSMSSNCVNTHVGNATGNDCGTGNGSGTTGTGGTGAPPNAVAAFADKLAKAIIAVCPASRIPLPGYAYVTTGTEACIDQIPSGSLGNYQTAVITRLHVSTNEAGNGGNLQCAGFVQAVSFGVNKPLPNGSAGQYARSGIPGYAWHPEGSGAQVGDIIVWDTHIAVVVGIPDPTHFKVAEANGGTGTVGEETYPYGNNPYGTGLTYLGYLRPQ